MSYLQEIARSHTFWRFHTQNKSIKAQ